MSTSYDSLITLQIDEPGGRRCRRVSAVCNGEVLHIDTFNAANHRRRVEFLRHVEKVAEERGLRYEAAGLEAALVNCAHEEVLNLNGGNVGLGTDGKPSEVLAALGLRVLGESDDLSIVLWSEFTRKTARIKSPSYWKAAEILQIIGPQVADLLWLGPSDNQPDGTYLVEEIQRSIALTAANASRISSVKHTGQGVWRQDDQILIVDGSQAGLYDGSDIEIHQSPVLGYRLLELDAAKQWHGSICDAVIEMTAKRSRQLLQRLIRLISNWNWTHPWDARVLAALVTATFVQAVWRWRPLVSITGPSDSGKSTFFQELLLEVFLKWAICADRSTEAGLRQAIAHDSVPVLIDEFDKYRQRPQVLELFRTSSRGGKVLRGTADQTGQQFALCHVPWFGAIETGDAWVQDRNRFINFELQLPESRCLILPAPAELSQLGRELAAASVWAVSSAMRLADVIKSTPIDGVHGRLIESFSVPAAMFAVLWHGRDVKEVQARKVLQLMIAGREALQVQGEPDEQRLLRDIFSTNLRVAAMGNGNRQQDLSIGQLLANHQVYQAELYAKGIRIVNRRNAGRQELFLVPDMVLRHLLSDTRWKESRIDQILLRIDGARRDQQRLGQDRPWGIALPWPGCLELENPQDVSQGEISADQ